jgi:hypothetical protein
MAVLVGVPGTYYLLPPMFVSKKDKHGHDEGKHGDAEGAHAEESADAESATDETEADSDSEKAAESGSEEESQQETEAEKGSGAAGEDDNKDEDSSKADSGSSDDEDPAPDRGNKPRTVAGAAMRQHDKQKGMSVGPTLHSSEPHGRKDQSQKSEGFAETTKLKGTVDRDREI